MSQPKQHQQPESTYRDYTLNQASTYARARGAYPAALIGHILKAHTSTGGRLQRVVDVGCGPGNSTRQFAPYFSSGAVGVDPSREMIEHARGTVGKGAAVVDFRNAEAEDLGGLFDARSVDLLTAASSAHWFDMRRFWPAAERIVKPGGSVAVFVIWRAWIDPAVHGSGAAREVHEVIRKLEVETVAEFEKEGNWCVIGLYEDLKMPWQLEGQEIAEGFPKELATRKVWNEDGQPGENGGFMSGTRVLTIEELAEMLGSQSAVTRWREANPQLVGGSDDVVVQAIAEIKGILGDQTSEIHMVGPTVLWMLKRK